MDRIKAAVDARTDEQFVIMARTDALANEGLAAAIERAQAYVAAGADMIFAEAVTELAMYTEFRKAVGVPILANITEFGQTPLFTRDELGSGGRGHHPLLLRGVPGDECGGAEGVRDDSRRGHAEERGADDADARRSVSAILTITRTRRSSMNCSRRDKDESE